MLEAVPVVACWKRDDADAMLRIEALGGDDTLFLATHTPIRGFGIGGAKRQDLAEPTEAALLDALADTRRSHAFCVVQGDPGSGKSHLIRWLNVHWPAGEDVVLLLQRADGSLQGALEQLKIALTVRWPEFAPLFENLDRRRQTAGIAGRAEVFQSTLGAMLKGTFFHDRRPDADWCDKHDLSLLIQSLPVRQGWSGPRRILELMDGKSSARNSESAQFNLDDVLGLAHVCGNVHDSIASARFARRLIDEAVKIRHWLDTGEAYDDIRSAHASELQASLPLLQALNSRLNDAVQSVIGVTGEDLILLFRRVRTALKDRARLVFLLEDITAWQGLDNGLIDALVLDASTRPDICPLISVVGVTPDYYDALQKNYRDRITHEVQLGQPGNSADAVTMRQSADRLAFVARYLNATRAGEAKLLEWGPAAIADRHVMPPNPCFECSKRTACHMVFGAVDSMGLFPFTEAALDTLFHALKADDKGQTHRTPRGLLQNVLGPTLRNPAILDEGLYPGPDIETEKFDERAGLLSGPMRALIDAADQDPETIERLRRTFVYWGDSISSDTTVSLDGMVRLAGVPEPLFESFRLPWLGDHEPALQPIADGGEPARDEAGGAKDPSDEQPVQPATEDVIATKPPARPATGPTSTTTTTGSAARRPSPTTKTKLQRLQGHVYEARTSKAAVKEAPLWNEVLFEILKAIDPVALGIDRWTWATQFTANNVIVAGSSQARNYTFAVQRETWLYDGLEAYCALRGGGQSETDQEYHRRRLAFMVRRLGLLAKAHVARRTPTLADGARWDMVATATQVLLARAWLKGLVSPTAPTAEQWRVVLTEEGNTATSPLSRTEPWQEALRNTDQQHGKLRPMLRDMVKLPQGDSGEFGIAAAGSAARAVIRLQRRMAFLPFSEATETASLLDDNGLRQTAAKMADYMGRIPGGETKLLRDRSAEAEGLLRGESLGARLRRIDEATKTIFPLLRELPADLERRWRETWERIQADLTRPEYWTAVQQLIVTIAEPDELPTQPADLLAWLVNQPAGDLRAALDALKQGDSLCTALNERSAPYLRSAGAGAALKEIKDAGNQLKAAADAAKTLWKVGS
jgi:hypothetical protein